MKFCPRLFGSQIAVVVLLAVFVSLGIAPAPGGQAAIPVLRGAGISSPPPRMASRASTDQSEWYHPGKSISEFHASAARIRALIGARGSGKTTAIAVESIGHCWHNPGAKVYILRKTQESNEDTTEKTFELTFREHGSAYVDTGYSLFKKIDGGKQYRLPSLKAVELFNEFLDKNPNKTQILRWLETIGNQHCSFINFAGVPDATKRDTRFRGYECSMLIFVEADQLAKADLDMGMACLRWKGADGNFIEDTCCILDTNPPAPSHWIAKMEEDTEDDYDVMFWHIPMVENEHNLPPGYVENMKRQYRSNPAMYRRMIEGEYAEAFDGSGVLFAFTEEHAFANLPFPRGAYLVRGWDFGTTHSCVWSAYWEVAGQEYWWDLYEYFARQSDTERQVRAVTKLTAEVFPFWNDRAICAGVYDACDPSGAAKTSKGRDIEVLHSWNVYPAYNSRWRSLPVTLSAYNRVLEKRDAQNRLVYRIDREACPMLYRASLGGYRYPEIGETGYGRDEPGKGPEFGDYDHIVDAARYAKVNFLRLMRGEMEKMAKPVGALAAQAKINPRRVWY